MTGLNSDTRWTTKAINKLLNKLIEVVSPRIFDVNQRLFNYAINNLVVPRINKILTMYSVIVPSSKFSGGKNRYDSVYLRELDDTTIIKYLSENPIDYPDEQRVLNMLFDDKFYERPIKGCQKRGALNVCRSSNWIFWRDAPINSSLIYTFFSCHIL